LGFSLFSTGYEISVPALLLFDQTQAEDLVFKVKVKQEQEFIFADIFGNICLWGGWSDYLFYQIGPSL